MCHSEGAEALEHICGACPERSEWAQDRLCEAGRPKNLRVLHGGAMVRCGYGRELHNGRSSHGRSSSFVVPLASPESRGTGGIGDSAKGKPGYHEGDPHGRQDERV